MNTLIFNRGKSEISLDINNCNFQPLVDLINDTNPKIVAVFGPLHNRAFLNVTRALFHSKPLNFKLFLYLDEETTPKEDYLFPLSKTFNGSAINVKKRKFKNVSKFEFLIKREPTTFKNNLSYYVISDGKDLKKLEETLKSIYAQEGSSPVVSVIGPDSIARYLSKSFPSCTHVSDKEIYGHDCRFPIAKKKNLIFETDRSERVAILHDRFTLPPTWEKRFLAHCRSFDIYSCRIEADGHRYLDKFGVHFKGYLSHEKILYYLTYGEDNSNQFLDGGFIVINRKTFPDKIFDERLHWFEMEDADFILNAKQNCALITFDDNNKVFSRFTTHFALNPKSPLQMFWKIYFRRWPAAFHILKALRFFKK